MNTEELKEHVSSLSKEIQGHFSKKDFLNKPLVDTTDIKEFFNTTRTVSEVKQFFSKFNDEDVVKLEAEIYYGYYEGDASVDLKFEVTINRVETDEELTDRILSKVNKIEKQITKRMRKFK